MAASGAGLLITRRMNRHLDPFIGTRWILGRTLSRSVWRWRASPATPGDERPRYNDPSDNTEPINHHNDTTIPY